MLGDPVTAGPVDIGGGGEGQGGNLSTTPITAMGCWQCLSLSDSGKETQMISQVVHTPMALSHLSSIQACGNEMPSVYLDFLSIPPALPPSPPSSLNLPPSLSYRQFHLIFFTAISDHNLLPC